MEMELKESKTQVILFTKDNRQVTFELEDRLFDVKALLYKDIRATPPLRVFVYDDEKSDEHECYAYVETDSFYINPSDL